MIVRQDSFLTKLEWFEALFVIHFFPIAHALSAPLGLSVVMLVWLGWDQV